MGFDHLEEINKLVFHVWDAAVLRCLLIANEPMRYSDIGTAVDQWSQRRPSDSDLTRSLDRLRKAGFVSRSESGTRRGRIYTLSGSGRERANKIGALISALEISATDEELASTRHHAEGGVDGDHEGGGPANAQD